MRYQSRADHAAQLEVVRWTNRLHVDVEIRSESASALGAYAAIPASFQVTTVLDVARLVGGHSFSELRVTKPYIKDYDAVPANSPRAWMERFELDRWGLFSARLNGSWVGAAAVSPEPLAPGASPSDAVLWDLRVTPRHRGRGIGRALFAAVESWACSRGRSSLLAETQHINVAACHLYARQGCVLHHVNAAADADFPDEVQLVWRKDLPVERDTSPQFLPRSGRR